MPLVSIRHLASPFRNSVHWVTILLLALAFMVLRMSGISIGVGTDQAGIKAPPAEIVLSAGAEDDAAQRARLSEGSRAKLQPPSKAKSDLVDEILEPVRKEKQDQARKQEEEKLIKQNSGKLDDIERMLGLR